MRVLDWQRTTVRSDRDMSKKDLCNKSHHLDLELKRSLADDEAIRRADAEAEKALTRARVLEERRAAKRASATSVQRVGRINGDGGHPAALLH